MQVRQATKLRDVLVLLRPAQWTKNAFVLAPLVFSHRAFHTPELVSAHLAFAAFCLASSASYIVNDVVDRERDREHPLKCRRPIAAGHVPPGPALVLAAALVVLAVGLGAALGPLFLALLAAFIGIQFLYSVALKTIVIVDVATIATLFVLRAAGGAAAVAARMSPWLLLCTFMLAMFLGLGKRKHEMILLKNDAGEHREVLGRYSVRLLDQLIGTIAVTTIIAYTAYTVWPSVQTRLGTERLYYTVPFVVFGISRYLYLVYRRAEGGNPTDLLLEDLPLQLGIVGWILTVFVLLYV